MKQDKQKHNWLIDVALFGGFLGYLWLDLTGVLVSRPLPPVHGQQQQWAV